MLFVLCVTLWLLAAGKDMRWVAHGLYSSLFYLLWLIDPVWHFDQLEGGRGAGGRDEGRGGERLCCFTLLCFTL